MIHPGFLEQVIKSGMNQVRHGFAFLKSPAFTMISFE